MERTRWPAIAGLLLGIFLLSRHVPTTFAFDKPLLTINIVLVSLAFTVLGLGRLLPKDDGRTVKEQHDDALPLNKPGHEVGAAHVPRQSFFIVEDVTSASSLRKLRTLSWILASAIVTRVAALSYILKNTQCAVLTWEPLLPFALACLEYWSVERSQKRPAYDGPRRKVIDAIQYYVVHSQYRYLVTVGLASVAGLISFATTTGPASTYICGGSQSAQWLTPLLQRVGTALDVVIAYELTEVFLAPQGRVVQNAGFRFVSVGWTLLRAALLWAGLSFIFANTYYIRFATPPEKLRYFEITGNYISSTLKLDGLLCVTTVCALLAVGLTTVAMLSTFVLICTLNISSAWNHHLAYPLMERGLSFIAICIAILGFALYCRVKAAEYRMYGSGKALFKKVPKWFHLTLLTIFFARTALWAFRTNSIWFHPIDRLMEDAKSTHEAYVQQASSSRTMAEAVKTYRERYNQHPPPGFDKWYRYATQREAVVIDNFDNIYHDLLPFYTLSPQDIRQRTWDVVSNRWHDANALIVRNGSVTISNTVLDTHRWMLEGITTMISKFAEHLPDMDLAINANDECRVVVPYVEIERMRQAGRASNRSRKLKPEKAFSAGRADQWTTVPKESNSIRVMEEYSWQRTFYRAGNTACPPGSPAREEHRWNVGTLCTSCVAPHSIGTFLADWSKAADICHQPDIAELHGFYTSPAAFKISSKLFPIFSQSRVHGFNDILYPSAWNYMDKIKHDPNYDYPDLSYDEKQRSLFWRGATSEGFSPGNGDWQGMTRQRVVHISNENNGMGSPQSVLIPSNSEGTNQKLTYSSIPLSDLNHMLSTNLHFVEITRCGGDDCTNQLAKFSPFAQPSDFQAHWRYKYLLDLDGAGFSGRFIPFLLSHSLPFKAALFREWWDDRLTAWHHFIPLDVRGHGLWATLAYFAGMEGIVNGRRVKLESHDSQGERVAENGRQWANAVLRKEDMEIYMFRLLLEWGRLTDDRRDSIGFDPDS